MNKRQKKKQLAVLYRKAYKGLRKHCQRRRLGKPKLDWHLPKFKKWKEGIILQNRYRKIFGLPPSPLYPSNIRHAIVNCILESVNKKLYFGGINNEDILEKVEEIL